MVDYKKTLSNIKSRIENGERRVELFEDGYTMCRSWLEEDTKVGVKALKEMRRLTAKGMKDYANAKMWDEAEKLRRLIYELYKLEAPYTFDAYCLALEYDRPVEEQFYYPRRKVLKTFVDELQRLADGEIQELFLSCPPRVGKSLANETPILTTKGWKKHGDLKVGDVLFAPDGKTTKVIYVHPKCMQTHKVTFTDGTEIICHFRHEWQVYDRKDRNLKTIETQVMIGNELYEGEEGKRGSRYRYQLVEKEFLQGIEQELPVDAYTLGAWLGDGSNNQPRITGDARDHAIIEKIEKNGYKVRKEYTHKTTGVKTYAFYDLREDLRKAGMCKSHTRIEKFIPTQYLYAPLQDRLELLAGLIDTDGCLVQKEKRYHYTTCEEKLKDTFVELIHTFGWRVSVTEKKPKVSSSGIVGRKVFWDIGFNPTVEIPVTLERKRLTEFSKQRRVAIKKIEKLEKEVEGNCITVERDGMYLAGKEMIPTHNTTLLLFYTTWIMGRNPDLSNLYSSFSDIITEAFYNGIMEVLTDSTTYHYLDIFPASDIARGGTNAKNETIDIRRKKHYPSLTCRSLYGTLNGACDCNGILIGDDLIGGIEEAMNKDRLISAWSKVDNNLLPRAKEKARVLWCGTRWSIADPTGIRQDLLENNENFKKRKFVVCNLPALDENDESNFDYLFGVGFSTDFYRQRRASFERNNDMASWSAQYMCTPIEREGTVFEANDFRYFNGQLPEEEPDRVFMAVDPAYGGGDYTAAPVCVQYGDDIYVPDVVYNNGEKNVTQPLLASKAFSYGVTIMQIEATKTLYSYVEGVQEAVRNVGAGTTIQSKPANNLKSKEQRIFDRAPDIREHFIFLQSGKRSKEYEMFMQNVFSFKIEGKNKHDDAPDSLCQASEMCVKQGIRNNIRIFHRPF